MTRSRAIVLGAAGLAAAAIAAPSAQAHATLSSSTPAVQSSLAKPPRQIVLRFDQAVSIVDRSIEVLAADGRRVSGAVVSAAGGRVLRASLPRLQRGAYTVRWRELSADGHIGSGVFTFGVGVAAPPPTHAVGASGQTWRDDLARWAAFAALALLLGPLVLRLVVLRGVDPGPRATRAFSALAVAGAFAAIDVGILAFVLKAENALRLSFVDLIYSDLSPFAEKTRFGIAFLVMMVGFGAVAGLAILAWVFDRPLLLWPALVLAVVLASGYSLSGHQATEPNSFWATELADWAHLVAASIWAGGVITLAAVIWPLAPAARRAAFLGFSRIAVVLVGVLVLAGTYLAVVRLPDVADLWTTSYGQVLLLKLGIVCVALAWGGAHHMLVRPRLERGEVPSTRVGRSLIGESTVAMAVLLVAAVLVNGSPPPVADGGGSAPVAQGAAAP
jgi:copper transport protein